MVQKRFDLFLEIIPIRAIDLGSDLQLLAGADCNLDGMIETFLRRDAAQEGHIISRVFLQRELVNGHAVVHRTYPIDLGTKLRLRVRDRNQRHLSEFLIQGSQIRDVKSPVQGCDMGHLLTPAVRKMQIVGMKMNDIEIFSPAEKVLDHQHMVRQRVDTMPIQPQRPLAAFYTFSVRYP